VPSDERPAIPRPVRTALNAVLASRLLAAFGAVVILVLVIVGLYVLVRLNDDRPVTYNDVRDHFKYGSTGGERGWKAQFGFGIPYWVWVAMPELFPQYLPDGKRGRGYASLGMIYEDGKDPRFDTPIGMSMRRVMGIDRVYFTCSVCHTGTVRDSPTAKRTIVLGMPSNVVNFGRVAEFIRRSAKDWRFESTYLLPKMLEIERLRAREHPVSRGYRPDAMGLIDRLLFRFVAISLMRDQLLALMGRLQFIDFNAWGPGRVDTFDPPKALLGFRMDDAPPAQRTGIADFPSVWNQKARKGMWLHWDGNNCSVDERNLSAAFGTGATPVTLDRPAVLRIADFLWEEAQPLPFPRAHINQSLASRGAPVYKQYCQSCHGSGRTPFRTPGDGSRVGTVTPIEEVQTDPLRLISYSAELAKAQNSLYAGFPTAGDEACREYIEGVCRADQNEARYRELRDKCYPARFSHFRKTYGYANQPLDGLWLRAPYLHNGSVPSIRALLEPKPNRPPDFYIGYDVYDFKDVGFVSSGDDAKKHGWHFDTSLAGNGNGGHDGAAYGTTLAPAEKDALIEYLKTF
jgi:RoxA-like, cytochrome c-like